MDCKAAKKLIPALLDDEIPGAKAQQINEHIAQCAGCRQELAVLRNAMEALEAWPGINNPSSSLAEIKARAAERIAGRWSIAGWLRPVMSPRWAKAALFVFAMLGGILGAYHNMPDIDHSHQFTAQMSQASDSLSLYAFGGGLNDVLYETIETDAGSSGVMQ